LQDKLYLGNLNTKRDWGHAKDYVEAMWLMLQRNQPEDFVIATGVTTEVREFVCLAFAHLGIEIAYKGEKEEEKGYIKACHHPDYQLETGKEVVAVDRKYFRPAEVDLLLGNPQKANEKLGWTPKYDLRGLVKEMMECDLREAKIAEFIRNNKGWS
jgi:GDPmannose 4,6-dehydratase